MKKNVLIAVMGLGSLFFASGCSGIGNAAQGPDEAQVKQREAALPPDKQIELLKSAPMPADEKAKKIKEIQDKYGLSSDGTPVGKGGPTGQG